MKYSHSLKGSLYTDNLETVQLMLDKVRRQPDPVLFLHIKK
jgi:hypothetical protein